jgi:hypothetical protein
VDGDLGPEVPGVGAEHQHPVGEQDGLLDVVGDDAQAAGRKVRVRPEFHQLVAQVLRGQHVQRGERLVHQQRVRLQDERAGQPDALPHPAGQLFRVGGLETVEADDVDRSQGRGAPLRFTDAAGQQAELDVVLHGQPGHQREGLEHHRRPRGWRR